MRVSLTHIALMEALAVFPSKISLIVDPPIDPKPMKDGGLPSIRRLGAKQSTYQPSPSGPPRSGSKRKRQWR